MSPRPWLSPFLQPAAPELAIVLVAPLSMTAVCPGGAGGPQCALTKPGVLQEVWVGHFPPPGTKALSRVCGDRPGLVS